MNFRRAFSALWAASLCACLPVASAPSAPRAVLITESGRSTQTLAILQSNLEQAGYTVRTVDFHASIAPNALAGAAMVVLPDATRLPADLHGPIERHVKAGGDLLAFGLPAWRDPLLKVDGQWVPAGEYARANAWTPPPHRVADFAAMDLSAWSRSTNDKDAPTTHEVVPMGEGRAALRVNISNLTSWDTFASPDLGRPFPAGLERTVFSAKGGPNTKSLAVEWTEKDGSRWIATVPVTTEWRRFELAPDSFRYWSSNRERGGPGDRFRPANAARLSVGLAFSHNGSILGRHEYWFANVGTAKAADAPLSGLHLAEELDGLYPATKSFPVRDVASLGLASGSPHSMIQLNEVTFPVRSPHPRPSGSGYDKGRKVRFVPLMEARSKDGAWRGVPGAAYVHADGPYKGSVWTVFGIALEHVMERPAFQLSLRSIAKWMRGPLLVEGGSAWTTHFPGQEVRLGARLAAPAPAGSIVRMWVYDPVVDRKVWESEWMADVSSLSSTWTPPPGALGPWRVGTELLGPDGLITDRIDHMAQVWAPPTTPHFITAQDGQLLLDGKPWKAHGVNYMPSSGVGRDHPADAQEFEHWIGKSAYDSAIVERDLDQVKRMGFNSVSIFIYGSSVDSGNLLDILRLCQERGLKVNLSLRPGTPLDFEWNQIRPIIERYRLAQNDVVFMYDLAWEPSWGDHEARAKYDARWTEWVRVKYGSLDAAERAWKFSPGRDGGILRNPLGVQTIAEGPWTAMVLDYRRFLNGLLDEAYGRARDLVRGVDRNHLVSFRMSEASNPTYKWDASLNYDFDGLKNAVDLFAPEGYGRRGEWEAVKPGWFQVAYARALNPALPVIWAEAGETVWEPGTDEAPMERQQVQARQAAAFYEMLNRSGSNGVYWWWYPGGYRTNENSDYGILNPDGTDRPVTKVIHDNAQKFLASPAPVKTDAEVRIRLDYATGLWGAYEDTKDEFWKLVEQGKSPRLKVDNPD